MKELVIAAYNRDYSWVDELPRNIKITVYKKGDLPPSPNEIIIYPNVGRDVHTFFYHLYTQYFNLSEITFFSQDFPFDHVANYKEIIAGDINTWKNFARQQNSGFWIFQNNPNLFSCDQSGLPHDRKGLKLKQMWENLFTSPCPSTIQFTPAGHFAVSKEQVHKLPRDYYKRIVDILITQHLAPWEIERMEAYIFLGEEPAKI